MNERDASQVSVLVKTSGNCPSYALVDTGASSKLERFSDFTVVRPEPQALWPKRAVQSWVEVGGQYKVVDGAGVWDLARPLPDEWSVNLNGVRLLLRLSASTKNIGVFPEQTVIWQDLAEMVKSAHGQPQVLNLFAYTGAGTLALASAGAAVTHVEAVKSVVEWASENQRLSGLADKPIRWIVDDARKYVKREISRGKTYDGIIVDAPKFGRGPKGEIWREEEDLQDLLTDATKLLSKDPMFIVVNSYTLRLSATSLGNMLHSATAKVGGSIGSYESALVEEKRGNILSQSIYSVWEPK